MRLTRQSKPNRFDERTISKFALFPVTARTKNGKRETRWLERVSVTQKFHSQNIHRKAWTNMEFE